MKRCLKHLFLALPVALLLALPAAAQTSGSDGSLSVRHFPKAALRGVGVVEAPPAVSLSGQPARLA
ncbi:MAG: hypothetical protein ACT6Q9_08210, partial [Polaromonas sp.]